MSHEIMGTRFITRSQPAWHGIAKRIFSEEEVITAREAMEEVAGDIEVVKAPLSFALDGERLDSEHVAIVRKPTQDDPKHHVLGVSKEGWVATSYPELAGALDELSSVHRVETAGLLKQGGTAFLCFRAPDWEVRGDEMRSYFAASFSLTPGIGHRVMHSPVRVVCWNTLTMAVRDATINLPISHSKDALQKIELAGKLVGQFKQLQARAQEVFDSFADTFVSKADVEAIFAAAFPNPNLPPKLRLLKQTLSQEEALVFKQQLTGNLLTGLEVLQEQYDKGCQRQARLRDTAWERFEAFDPTEKRGTIWAAYNAATEVSDWREGRLADESCLVGARADEKARAFVAALELVK